LIDDHCSLNKAAAVPETTILRNFYRVEQQIASTWKPPGTSLPVRPMKRSPFVWGDRKLVTLRNVLQHTNVAFDVACGVMDRTLFLKNS
jgi:hypothetical protein